MMSTLPLPARAAGVCAFIASLLVWPGHAARADIFQWEYINPDAPIQGKRLSTTLAPDGAGVNAAPGADLTLRDLRMAYLIGADLTGAQALGANLFQAELGQANLTQANLTNANLDGATITGTILTGARVQGATFTFITKAQLYSTSSYQARDLTGIRLYQHDLVGVNLAGQNLTNAAIQFAGLENADFGQANLTGATVWAGLAGANFTGAMVRGANLSGISAAQLSSTASYQQHDLSGVWIYGDLPGANLTAQNLANTKFENSALNNADFSHADLANAVFWYTKPISANFRHANLAKATFRYSDLTGADLTGADVRGTSFLRDEHDPNWLNTGLTAAQLYSTASYLSRDLAGINLQLNSLAGVDLAGQKLTNAGFSGAALLNANFSGADLANADFSSPAFTFFDVWTDLTGANLSHANLTNARFHHVLKGFNTVPGADLTGANLSGADARGADFSGSFFFTAPITTNLIRPDGRIAGLSLTAGRSLVVRDYDGNPTGISPHGPLPIIIEQQLAMDATGTLRLLFEADPWDSTISFAPNTPVALGGTLELAFAPDVNLATQVGRTLDVFDWTGVTPTGTFSVSSPYSWDLSNLYTTGEITLAAVPNLAGDVDLNGMIDIRDFFAIDRGWALRLSGWTNGDLTADGQINADDYAVLDRAFLSRQAGTGPGAPSASVPEPATAAALAVASGALLRRRKCAAG